MGNLRSSEGSRRGRAAIGIAIALVLAAPSVGRAFTEYTTVSDSCHERLTLDALGRVGWPGGSSPPAPTELDAAVADSLPFPLAADRSDPFTVAMMLGVRHPDLAGLDPTDLPALANLAADPTLQAPHCLRAPGDDGDEGNLAALAACRAQIRLEVERAIGEGDTIDLEATEVFEVWLVFRDSIELPFPRFAFRMGLALHALQDSFSHALRDPETARVRHVMNYVDPLHRGYEEATDGLAHKAPLDQCEGGPDSRVRRVAWAADASADLLRAVVVDAPNRQQRLARVDEALDRWLAYVPGCTAANDYCDAPELDERAPSCAAAEPGRSSGSVLALFAPLALLFFRRGRSFFAVVAIAWLVGASVAFADPPPDGAPPGVVDARVEALDLDPDVEVVEVHAEEDEATVVTREQRELSGGAAIERGPGFQVNAFGGIDEGVVGASFGPRFDYIPWMIFGLDAEFEPWFSVATGDTALGVFNVALVADFIYGKIGIVELRGHVAAGASVLLFDLPAADRGTTGPFAGGSPLGVAIRVTRSVRIVVEPGGLYFAIPQVRGFPLVHRHHRFTLGVQFTP